MSDLVDNVSRGTLLTCFSMHSCKIRKIIGSKGDMNKINSKNG